MSAFAGSTTVFPIARPGSAYSAEAETVRKAANAVLTFGERSIALFGPKDAAISQIWALVNECADRDWDGQEGEPMSEVAAEIAEDFIRALPKDVPLPEIAPEPDGSISLDWIQSRNRLFSLSAVPSSRLAYAWLDGTDRGHAVAHFDRETVPPRILEGIRMTMRHGS